MATNPPNPEVHIDRTVRQICTPDGTPYKGYATSNIWVNGADPYPKSDGNKVTPLLTGQAYFEQLADAITTATRSIYMLGWMINWDVHLKPGKRLYDVILSQCRAEKALKVYVLPWSAPQMMNTFDQQTVTVLGTLNQTLGGDRRVFCLRAPAHPNSSKGIDGFFSHHQKQVVIDERLAFVGGIDVAYGRRDDATFSLDAHGRRGNDAYNGCIPHVLAVSAADYVDCSLVAQASTLDTDIGGLEATAVVAAKRSLAAGHVQAPLDGCMLDPARQPRMPWQDVELMVEGPAATDLASNFVLRWNVAARDARTLGMGGAATLTLPAPMESKPGTCCVQMLRSASSKMVDLEVASVSPSERHRVHGKSGHNHIHQAMVQLIEHAEEFIYIENQFFVSAFGQTRFGDANGERATSRERVDLQTAAYKEYGSRIAWGAADALPENLIAVALGAKLRNVIMDIGNAPPDGKTSRFHVYITLPVHSEGMLNDVSYMTQVHFTMQTLVYGTQSLINRIRRAIKARQLHDKDDVGYARVFDDANKEYQSVAIDQCWPYVTLLNLRNWAQLGDRYVTEQIYIHSKVMIVDDRYAIVGSANINDRSLLGDRDSELAVLVMDTAFQYEDIGSIDGATLTRGFARQLRIKMWEKIFGITGGVRPAIELREAIEKPAAQGSWEAIRKRAEVNSAAYEIAFNFIPKNSVSIWPTIKLEKGKRRTTNGKNIDLMPFDPEFWEMPRHSPKASSSLAETRGFITSLPWLWTIGEDNNSRLHSSLYVELDKPGTTNPVQIGEVRQARMMPASSSTSDA